MLSKKLGQKKKETISVRNDDFDLKAPRPYDTSLNVKKFETEFNFVIPEWEVELSKTSKVNLVHRRDEFRGAQATVDKVNELEKSGIINVFTKFQLNKVNGSDQIKNIDIKHDDGEIKTLETNYLLGFLPYLRH